MTDKNTKDNVIKELREFSRLSGKHDRPAIRELIDFIKAGQIGKALKCYKHMDTFVRDGVPESVLLFLRENNPKSLKKEFRFSLLDDTGKEVVSAIAVYHPTKEELNNTSFAYAVMRQAEDWQKEVFKLKIEEVK